MKKIKICPKCGKKYFDIGTLPQMCVTCWGKEYALNITQFSELDNYGTLYLHIKEQGKWYSIIIEHWSEKFQDGIYRNTW